MNCKLYLSGFPRKWQKAEIENFIQENFSKHGEYTTSVQYSPSNFGFFAFVNYNTILEASNAKDEMGSFQFYPNSRKRLYINYAKDKEHITFAKKSNLVIRSIKLGVEENQIKEKFQKFGEIEKVSLSTKTLRFDDGQEKKVGIGFIHFSNPSEAQVAFTGARSDPEIMELIDEEMLEKDPNFIHFARDKRHHGRKIPQALLQR